MLSDEERERIVERLRVEAQLRKQLSGEEDKRKPSRWGWLESKLGLLILGAIVSGLLVPFLQKTQEDIKWVRQNRYDNLKYRVESVRAAIKELTLTHTFVAEAVERAHVEGEPRSRADTDAYKKQLVEMHNRRFQQNAKFSSALALLPLNDREAAGANFNRYLSVTQQLMNLLLPETASDHVRSPSPDKKAETTESLMEDANVSYEKTLGGLNDCLRRLELEGERFK